MNLSSMNLSSSSGGWCTLVHTHQRGPDGSSVHVHSLPRTLAMRGEQGVKSRRMAQVAVRAVAREDPENHADKYSVLLECDGVLVDMHIAGHMESFNRAFSELGYDCVRWTNAIYHDLLRTGDGTGIGMISSYFGRVGWPLMLPTDERQQFAQQVYDLKCQHLRALVDDRALVLRQGVKSFLGNVLADDAAVGIITETNSTPDTHVVDAVLELLGADIAPHVRVFPTHSTQLSSSSDEEVDDWGDVDEVGVVGGTTLEQAVQQAQAKAKARDAAVFAKATRSSSGNMVMGVAPHLLAGDARVRDSLLSAGFVSAANLTMGTSSMACAVLAASHRTMEAAQGAGALSVAVPPSLSARGRFAAADVSFDGFGPGGGAAWPRIKNMLAKRRVEAPVVAQHPEL